MLIKIIELIITTWCSLAMLRLFLQKGGMHYSHPMAQFCSSLTQKPVKWARKIIRPIHGWDFAIAVLVFALLLTFNSIYAIVHFVTVKLPFSAAWVALWIVLESVILWSCATAYALIICLIIQAVLSFADSRNSTMGVMERIVSPLTKPFSALRIGRFDFSPTVIFLMLWLWVGVCAPLLQVEIRNALFL